MRIRSALRAALGGLILVVSASAFPQAYPERPVTVIIPFPPGGTLDFVGRLLSQKLGDQMGQNFVVDNRAGAGGTIGAGMVARAQPNGYTLLFNASTFTTTPMAMATPPYDVVKDFQPIALVALAPMALAINPNVPATDLKGLIAHARANPGKVTFGTAATASASHLATEALKRSSGIDFLIVFYKGSGPVYQDLIGGRIDAFIDPILGSAPHAKAGRLKVIAVTSKNRLSNLPDIPAMAETVPGFEFYSWYGLWGPAKLPNEMVQRLNAEVNEALAGDMRDKLVPQGLVLTPGSVADFVRFQKDDMERSAKIITEGKIRVE